MPDNTTVLIYNGVPLRLGRLRVQQRAVYDESDGDYLFTHYVLEAPCVWSPAATATNPVPGPNGVTLGDRAPVSLANLRELLMQPRQYLQVYVGNDLYLQSPQLTQFGGVLATDANNGPQPIDFRITEVLGTKSILGVYRTQTWLNETAFSPASPGQGIGPAPALLSHRWEQAEEIDEDFLSTRTTRGTATFRTDLLLDAGAVADDFRNALFHPTPPNYRRVRGVATASDDGTKLAYQITDAEQSWNVGPGRGLIRLRGHKEYGDDWSASTLPRVTGRYHLEAQAMPGVRSVDIAAALLFVAAAHMDGLQAGGQRLGDRIAPWFGWRLRVDFPERHGELEAFYNVSGGFALVSQLLGPKFKWPEDFGDIGGPSSGPNARPGLNQFPPHGSRGEQLISILSQINNVPFTKPARPPGQVGPFRTPRNLFP